MACDLKRDGDEDEVTAAPKCVGVVGVWVSTMEMRSETILFHSSELY